MKEAICSCLAHSRGKSATHLTCPSSVQPTTGQCPLAGRGWQKPSHPAGPLTAKKSMRRYALMSMRLLLILISLCASFLLTLAVQAVTNSPVLAASNAVHADPAGDGGGD